MTDPAYESWLSAGFAWLHENWTDQAWPDVREGFVAALGLASAADDPVAQALITEIDEMPADEQQAAVLDAGTQARLMQSAVGAAGAAEVDGASPAAGESPPTPAPGDAPATEPAADVEPVYVEGTGWMRWDAAAASWVSMEAEAAAATPAAPGDVAAAGESETPAAGESEAAAPAGDAAAQTPATEPADVAAEPADVAAEPPAAAAEPAEVATAVAEQVVLPALTEALAAMPELAQIPAEELNQLMSEVLAERVAAMS
jgi:nicotinate-nucleotide--dimethylbenzimidazole phosphoribosyltransferase